MCNVLKTKLIANLFGVEVDNFHDLKEELLNDFKNEIEENSLGRNPDVGWCGEPNNKKICFKSRINVGSICLDYLISDYN